MAPANTGRDNNSNTAVIRTDHTNRGIESKFIEDERIFIIVVMKLIAPRMDDAPARCSLKIAKSTEIPE
jgi:hypothetical protein